MNILLRKKKREIGSKPYDRGQRNRRATARRLMNVENGFERSPFYQKKRKRGKEKKSKKERKEKKKKKKKGKESSAVARRSYNRKTVCPCSWKRALSVEHLLSALELASPRNPYGPNLHFLLLSTDRSSQSDCDTIFVVRDVTRTNLWRTVPPESAVSTKSTNRSVFARIRWGSLVYWTEVIARNKERERDRGEGEGEGERREKKKEENLDLVDSSAINSKPTTRTTKYFGYGTNGTVNP